MTEALVGEELAGCRIEEVAGRGGMGVVFRATQIRLQRTVALKVIAPEHARDDLFRARFNREAIIAASIEHPNAIPIYEAGEKDDVLYLMMRFVDGTDLKGVLASEGQLSAGRAAELLIPIAAALHGAHRRGLVHRDVKPANVLIAKGEDGEHVYLTDFGIARHADDSGGGSSTVTSTGVFIGTMDYLAPERIRGEKGDGRSDIYAFGCMLFEALTGQVPFPRDNPMARLHAHSNEGFPSLLAARPDLSAELEAVVMTATAKDPEHRYATAADLGQALKSAAGGGAAATRALDAATRPMAAADLAALATATGATEAADPAEGPTQLADPAEAPTRLAGGGAGRPPPPGSARGHVQPRPRGPEPLPGSPVAAARGPGGPVKSGFPPKPTNNQGPIISIVAGVLLWIVVGGGGLLLVNSLSGDDSKGGFTDSGSGGAGASGSGPGGSGGSGSSGGAAGTASVPTLSDEDTGLFRLSAPDGWDRTNEEKSPVIRVKWTDPEDSSTSVLVDVITPAGNTATERADNNRSRVSSEESGYQELSFESTTLGGEEAVKWVYEVPGGRRVDYFVNRCDDAFAILGSAPAGRFDSLESMFDEVAESVRSGKCE